MAVLRSGVGARIVAPRNHPPDRSAPGSAEALPGARQVALPRIAALMPAILIPERRQALCRRTRFGHRARRRQLRHPGRRILRPARAERRRQDHLDQHPRRFGESHQRFSVSVLGHDVVRDFAGRAAQPRHRAARTRVRSVLHGARGAAPAGRLFRRPHRQAWPAMPGSTSCSAHLGLSDKADANMRQLSGGMKRRVLVAQATGPPAAGDRARRTHRRGRRRIAPDAVAIRRPAQPRRPHRAAQPPTISKKPKLCAGGWRC